MTAPLRVYFGYSFLQSCENLNPTDEYSILNACNRHYDNREPLLRASNERVQSLSTTSNLYDCLNTCGWTCFYAFDYDCTPYYPHFPYVWKTLNTGTGEAKWFGILFHIHILKKMFVRCFINIYRHESAVSFFNCGSYIISFYELIL